jgi:cyclic beta-1,2-glucan synthetase
MSTVWLDGVAQADGLIPLVDDGAEHSVELNWPRSS